MAYYLLSPSVLSPDGKSLFVGEPDGNIRIFNLDTGLSRRAFTHRAWSLAISPDGTRLVSAGYLQGVKYNAIIWDAASGKQLRSIEVGEKGVGVVAFSCDGKKFLVGGTRDDPNLRIFDVASGAQEYALAVGDVSFICCSPDGKTLITASHDNIRILDLTTGALIRTIKASGNEGTRIGISPDARTIAVPGS